MSGAASGPSSDTPERPFGDDYRFTLTHLLYATAVIGVSLGLMGAAGVPVAVAVLICWSQVRYTAHAKPTAIAVAVILLVMTAAGIVILPKATRAREMARAMQCQSRFKMLALAIHNYADVYRTLPPAAIVDGDGGALHSWRVLLLPFMEQQALHAAYDFNSSWDSPQNTPLHDRFDNFLCCASLRDDVPQGNINFAAVVGDNAAFSPSGARNFDHFTAGLEGTAMLIETNPPGTPYMQPTDLSYEEAIELLTDAENVWQSPHYYPGFFSDELPRRHIAMADGSINCVYGTLTREQAETLLSVDDVLNTDVGEWGTRPQRLNMGNCVRFGLFVVVLLLPLPWTLAFARQPSPPAANA